MRSASILIVLLLLLGGVTFGYLTFAGDDLAELHPAKQDAWSPDIFEPKSKPDDLTAEPEELSEEQIPAGLLAIDREEVAGEQGEARELVVQVWDRKKGVPAAGAAVFFLEGNRRSRGSDPFAPHWSDAAEAEGSRFETDGDGRVRLPAVRGSAIVSAKRPGAFGFRRIGRRHKKVESITLQLDETVVVRVVDHDGEPAAGVPVGILQRIPVRENPEKKEFARYLVMMEKELASMQNRIQSDPSRAELVAKMRELEAKRAAMSAEFRDLRRAREKQSRRVRAQQKGSGKMDGKKTAKGRKGQKGKQKRKEPEISTRRELRGQRRTDDQGLATFRHFQIYRKKAADWWPAQHVSQFEAVLMMPLSESESREFSVHPVPAHIVELRMPPTGSVGLRMVDAVGRPYAHAVNADLQFFDAKTESWQRVRGRKEQGEAAIEFPFVGLGLQLTARAKLDDDDFQWNVPPFMGPSEPGERRVVDVVVVPEGGLLFGRVLDAAGKPLAGARPTFLINTSAGRLEGEDVTLDAEGRFHLPFLVPKRIRSPFHLEVRHTNPRPPAGVVMALPALTAGRVTDVGDVKLAAFQPVSFGTVVDDRGEPIPGARVQLQRERLIGEDSPRLTYVDEAFAEGRANEEGYYEIYGDLLAGRYRLRVEARNHFRVDTPDIIVGKRLDVTLNRNSNLVGTVTAPDWIRSRSVLLRLESVNDRRQRRDERLRDHRGKKYVYFGQVRPGVYNLEVRVFGFEQPILRVDGIDVQPGREEVHPRLQDLNLGSYLYRFEVAAVDPRGQPVEPAGPLLAKIVGPKGTAEYVGFAWRGNRCEIFSASPQLEVRPLTVGYRADSTVLAHGRSEIRFSPMPPIELELPGLRQIVGDTRMFLTMELLNARDLPNRVEVRDQRRGRSRTFRFEQLQKRSGGWFGQGDSMRVSLPVGGRYRVGGYLQTAHEGYVSVAFGEVDVRLPTSSTPMRIPMKVDATSLQAAFAKLQQRNAEPGNGRR